MYTVLSLNFQVTKLGATLPHYHLPVFLSASFSIDSPTSAFQDNTDLDPPIGFDLDSPAASADPVNKAIQFKVGIIG